MHLYNTNYSNTHDTMQPQFKIQGNGVYSTAHNPTKGSRTIPWFEVRGNKMYPTNNNPTGHSLHPWYEMRGNEVYQTLYHPQGKTNIPVFHKKI